MRIAHTAAELTEFLRGVGSVGFVPTMGALHEGHATLLRQSVKENGATVLSVFVNPTQFGPGEDFSRYPRTFEADCALAEAAGVAVVFAPAAEEIYPEGWSTYIEVENVSAPWCGRFRPGHFRGVATVVHRLFSLVRPTVAYFGLKDLQQFLVIQRMVRDLRIPLRVEGVPTVRESDGLALSSRNRYLSAEERFHALVIFRSLSAVKSAYDGGERDVSALLAKAGAVFAEVPEFKVQYAEIRSLPDLGEIPRVEGEAAFAVAGYLGKTRLIDNIILRS